MSTALNPKKILRQITAERPSGPLSAAFGEIDREVFSELVTSYYNGEEIGSEIGSQRPPAEATEQILKKYGTDFLLFRRFERMAFLLLHITAGFNLTDSDPSDEELDVIQKAGRELDKNRDMFVAAVKWLCSPKEMKPVKYSPKVRKLWKSGKLEVGRYPWIERNHDKFVKYFEDHGLKHLRIRASLQDRLYLLPRYIHFVDLFCGFLLSECQSKLPSEMPFKVCGKCEKLFFSRRVDAEFCSDDCRHRRFWTPERHRDHTFVSRLLDFAKKWESKKFGYTDQDLRKKVQTSTNRLTDIEDRWRDTWPTIIQKINKIRHYHEALG